MVRWSDDGIDDTLDGGNEMFQPMEMPRVVTLLCSIVVTLDSKRK